MAARLRKSSLTHNSRASMGGQEYSRVSGIEGTEKLLDGPEDENILAHVPTERRPGFFSKPLGIALIAITSAIIAALFTSFFTAQRTTALSPSTANITTPTVNVSEPAKEATEVVITGCGSTPGDARAAGCVYDVMMQLWTPPACMDWNLTNKYLANNNWTWYADSNAEHIMSDEEIALGEHDVVYVAQDYHVKHCIFAWEKVIRALRTQQPLIEELISYDHIIHCRDHTLLPALDASKHVRGVVAPTGWTHCAPYETWIKALPHNDHSSTD